MAAGKQQEGTFTSLDIAEVARVLVLQVIGYCASLTFAWDREGGVCQLCASQRLRPWRTGPRGEREECHWPKGGHVLHNFFPISGSKGIWVSLLTTVSAIIAIAIIISKIVYGRSSAVKRISLSTHTVRHHCFEGSGGTLSVALCCYMLECALNPISTAVHVASTVCAVSWSPSFTANW